jgi:hypothetical protein
MNRFFLSLIAALLLLSVAGQASADYAWDGASSVSWDFGTFAP